jgi:hypothetical protein
MLKLSPQFYLAAIERFFSNFVMIQSKLRNRLGLVKAGKLVFCYRMLRGKDEIDWRTVKLYEKLLKT